MTTEVSLSEVYQPLRLNYRTISTEPVSSYQVQTKYPISVEIPEVPQSLKIAMPDILQRKSYEYNIQIPSPSSIPLLRNYNFDVQVPSPPST